MKKILTGKTVFYSLLIFIPITLVLEFYVHAEDSVIFLCSALAIVPLVGLLAKATEGLADHLGPGIGGLLSATFGNAPELMIGIIALREGLFDVVKASLTGAIIANILLVFGAGAILGGLRYPVLRFNSSAACIGTTMLALSAIGLLLPAIYHHVVPGVTPAVELNLGLAIAIVLLVTYILNLVFSLKTHRHLYTGIPVSDEAERENEKRSEVAAAKHGEADQKKSDLWRSLGMLAVSAGLIAWMSEMLVTSVEGTARQMGMSQVFIGVIFVAIIGNAAEQSTSIFMALKNKMDLAINITTGASIQIALFVAPLLLILSYFIAPAPMDLTFTTMEVVSVMIAVGLIRLTAHDGDMNWIEGVQLVAVYIMLAIMFYLMPA